MDRTERGQFFELSHGYNYSIINRLINNEICILGYPKGVEIIMSKGKLIKIDNYEFTHLANYEEGRVFDEKGNILQEDTAQLLFRLLIVKLKEDGKCIIC